LASIWIPKCRTWGHVLSIRTIIGALVGGLATVRSCPLRGKPGGKNWRNICALLARLSDTETWFTWPQMLR
jgi:hypothetical protein